MSKFKFSKESTIIRTNEMSKFCLEKITLNTSNLAKNYESVTNQILAAETAAGRPPNSVQLVAVSKLHSPDSIRALANLGQNIFAENFVQEALEKQKLLADLNIEWHFIGRIQSNKTKEIANRFSWVHSVDRLKIANRIADQRDPALPPMNLCVQINLQQEQSKSGIPAEEAYSFIEQISSLPTISVRGLMIIPEPESNSDKQRAVFAQLRGLRDEINNQGFSLDTLSMGMTADMEAAIAEGATHVRIGTALFGPRPT